MPMGERKNAGGRPVTEICDKPDQKLLSGGLFAPLRLPPKPVVLMARAATRALVSTVNGPV